MNPTCLAPNPEPRPPRAAPPASSCDCHAHVYPGHAVHPFADDRSYTPPPAPLDAYRYLHATLGLERAVIVQPSVHGTDNSVTLDAIAGYGAGARGVAVVDPAIADADLTALDAGGIRGVRFNILFRGGTSLDALADLAPRIAPMGWHIQLLIDVSRDLQDIASVLRDLPVPVVFDHMGHMDVGRGIDDPGFMTMLRLLEGDRFWVKLSGNYRISRQVPGFADAVPIARALVDANPSRCVWGSDWPHPALTEFMPNDGDLLDALDDYAPDPEAKRAVLVDNPATLYGFP